jgi:hypothetical protein
MLDRGHPRAILPDYHLASMSRGLLTYPHLMNSALSQALSPVTPPYTGHSFGQPSPLGQFLPQGHQLFAPAMMPPTPNTAIFHGGSVNIPQAHVTYMELMAQAQAQYANQQRN